MPHLELMPDVFVSQVHLSELLAQALPLFSSACLLAAAIVSGVQIMLQSCPAAVLQRRCNQYWLHLVHPWWRDTLTSIAC